MTRTAVRVAFALSAAVLASAAASAEPAPPPAPYAAPFQLRPAAVGNAFRSDTSAAFYRDASGTGSTLVTTLLASRKITPTLAPFARFAILHDDPTTAGGVTGNSNALAGITWAPEVAAPFKLAVIGAMTAPIASGGGNAPDMAKVAANKAAILARSAMDNAMFAANDVALVTGAGAAYVQNKLTLQAEATLFELVRVKGAGAQPDKAKTNLTSGLYAGYFVVPQLSFGAELRYQRYLSTPKFVSNDPTAAIRDTLTAAGGIRTHWKLEGKRWLRPGLAYARGLDAPINGRHYQIVQLDVLYAY